jgi:hypothetical protein
VSYNSELGGGEVEAIFLFVAKLRTWEVMYLAIATLIDFLDECHIRPPIPCTPKAIVA